MDNHCDVSAALMASLVSGLNTINETLPPIFSDWLTQYQTIIANLENPKILLLEPDPLRFCAAAIAFFKMGRGSLFLGNPAWKIAELSQVAQILEPDCLWGSPEMMSQWLQVNNHLKNESPKSTPYSRDQLLIYFPTGGSSGKIRFVAHSVSTLTAAVQGLIPFLNPFLDTSSQINSFCLLPLFHVGGFMQWWRSALTGGKFCLMDYGTVKTNPPQLNQHGYITSLVPTQLNYLMHHQPQFLTQFQLIFLGGAPAWSELLAQARLSNLPLAPTYGMTETAGQIATLTPTEFLQGKGGVGQVLPHGEVTIKFGDRRLAHNSQASQRMGLITLKATSLFLGYYPQLKTFETWETGDLGMLKNGYLWVIGRQNRQIISGGENIDPQEIENYLLTQNLVKDIIIVGLGDRHWGEALTAIFVPQDYINIDQIARTLKTHLAPHKCPKHWLPVPEIQRSSMGKVNYKALQAWAEAQIHQRD